MCFLSGVNCSQGQSSKSMVASYIYESVCVFSHLTDSMTLSAVSFLLVQSSGIRYSPKSMPLHVHHVPCALFISTLHLRNGSGERGVPRICFLLETSFLRLWGSKQRVLMRKLDHWLLEVWDAWLFFWHGFWSRYEELGIGLWRPPKRRKREKTKPISSVPPWARKWRTERLRVLMSSSRSTRIDTGIQVDNTVYKKTYKQKYVFNAFFNECIIITFSDSILVTRSKLTASCRPLLVRFNNAQTHYSQEVKYNMHLMHRIKKNNEGREFPGSVFCIGTLQRKCWGCIETKEVDEEICLRYWGDTHIS